MIVDEAKIFVRAGKGGDGGVYFRHEKYVPKGGPDGGDGGDGGDVVFVADEHASDLNLFARQNKFLAPDGQNGGKRLCSGKNGEDLILKVPPGTQIYGDQLLADLVHPGDRFLAAKGGQGGWGNHHFATSVKQAPQWAKEGLPGEGLKLRLELKMIADVGLVGLPNAGKSTLLSVISNARPKIADYPFTTLEPNLGVVRTQNKSIIVADIPGLIEGASKGKGLGDKFLKHIERTKSIIQLISAESEDLWTDFRVIEQELNAFSKKLAEKPKLLVLTKAELLDEKNLAKAVKTFKSKKLEILPISAQTHYNIDKLINKLLAIE